jgi:hypothetical protein
MTFLSMQTIPNEPDNLSVWQAGLRMSDVRTCFPADWQGELLWK